MATSAAAPLAAPAFDLESGGHRADESKAEKEEDGEISVLYHIVYGFSLVMLVLGVWAFFFPFSESHIVGTLSGLGGLVTGVFLMLNADLMVTFLRLMHEMKRFKESNKKYQRSLVEQKRQVRKLKEAEKAFERLDSLCHGHMEDMKKECDELMMNARDATRRAINGVLDVTRPQRQDVRAGKEFDKITNMFKDIYARPILDVEARFAEMEKGFAASERWQKVQVISVNRLKFVLAGVLFDDVAMIKGNVTSKAEARTDEQVSGWHATASDALDMMKNWSSQYNQRLSTSAKEKSLGGADDDWADAAAFVAGGQEEGPAAVTKEDSWADAMDFAGVDK